MMMRRGLLAMAAVLAWSAGLFGQVLVDQVPGDAAVYIGWKGSESLGADYEQSRLKSLLRETDLSLLLSDDFQTEVTRAITSESKVAPEDVKAAFKAIRTLWRYPSAFYMGTPAGAEAGAPMAFYCKAGAAAAGVSQELRTSLEGNGWAIAQQGDLVIVSRQMREQKAGTLAAVPEFVRAMKQVDAAGVMSAYVDVERLLAAAGDLTADKKLIGAMGLDGVKRAAMSAGFAGREWCCQAWVDAPAPRRGIARLLDGKPLSDGIIDLVPQTASAAWIVRGDLASMWDELRESMVRYDANQGQTFDGAVSQINALLRVDVRKALLPLFGDEWAVFSDPVTCGEGLSGWVLVHQPKDAARLQEALQRLQDVLLSLGNGMARSSVRVSAQSVNLGEVTVTTIRLPMVAPSWTVRNGVLYAGLYPQTVIAAAGRKPEGKDSIMANAGFAALRKRLGGNPSCISFVDLPQTVDKAYGRALMFSEYMGFAGLAGIQTPVRALPPLAVLRENLVPSGSASWVDAEGWHLRSVTPFPGATALTFDAAGGAWSLQMPILAAIIIPQFTSASNDAKLSATLSTVQSVRAQCELYRLQHLDRYPDFEKSPNWEQLLGVTDEQGKIAATGRRYGPYLMQPPMNPFRNATGVKVVRGAVGDIGPIRDAKVGWVVVISPSGEQRFYALDQQGRIMGGPGR